MIDLVRSEWIKLHTVRVNYVLGIIGAAFPLIVVVLVAALSGEPELRFGNDLVRIVIDTMVISAILFGVIGALNLTSEYSHGTIRTTFAAVPQRATLLLVKAGVSLAATTIFATIVMIVTYGIGAIILSGRNAQLSIDGNGRTALIGIVILCGMLSLFGYGLGLIIRNSAATVAVFILWPLLLENIVRGVLSASGVHNPTPWLPYQSAFAMASSELGPGDPSRLHGGLYLGAVVVVIIAIGIVVNERRDA
ncbi:unannotated protein [freshwater metagenome]|uniref:Unannotated protein n=1 Tax=freshwater metagenome TaxID=449393 RepID=A0A6J7EBW2_9ZZZZ|nr:ABC transporter permease subunit [Actinomycetota bacterium]